MSSCVARRLESRAATWVGLGLGIGLGLGVRVGLGLGFRLGLGLGLGLGFGVGGACRDPLRHAGQLCRRAASPKVDQQCHARRRLYHRLAAAAAAVDLGSQLVQRTCQEEEEAAVSSCGHLSAPCSSLPS